MTICLAVWAGNRCNKRLECTGSYRALTAKN